MKFHPTLFAEARLIDLTRRGDDRGFFARTFCADEFAAEGLPAEFVQQNMSYSANKGTLRGMHFQRGEHAEDKLIRCTRGAIKDIILDLRPDSPTYMVWEAFDLTEDNKRQLLVPKGFAHGFQAVTDHVEVSYLVSSRYAGAAEGGVRWNDPAFAIDWPLEPTDMSEKDKTWPDYKPA
jgi:dTDP-4-dehydrorhamnose 3,5-epimerase